MTDLEEKLADKILALALETQNSQHRQELVTQYETLLRAAAMRGIRYSRSGAAIQIVSGGSSVSSVSTSLES